MYHQRMALAKCVKLPRTCVAMLVAPCRSTLGALVLAGPCQDHWPGKHQGKGSLCHTFLECTVGFHSAATPHRRDICWTVSPGAVWARSMPWMSKSTGATKEERQTMQGVRRASCSKSSSPRMAEPGHGSAYPKDHTLAMALMASCNHCIGTGSTLHYASPACCDLSTRMEESQNKVL